MEAKGIGSWRIAFCVSNVMRNMGHLFDVLCYHWRYDCKVCTDTIGASTSPIIVFLSFAVGLSGRGLCSELKYFKRNDKTFSKKCPDKCPVWSSLGRTPRHLSVGLRALPCLVSVTVHSSGQELCEHLKLRERFKVDHSAFGLEESETPSEGSAQDGPHVSSLRPTPPQDAPGHQESPSSVRPDVNKCDRQSLAPVPSAPEFAVIKRPKEGLLAFRGTVDAYSTWARDFVGCSKTNSFVPALGAKSI